MQLAAGVHVIEAEFWGRPLFLPLFVGDHVTLADTGLVGMGTSCVLPYLERLSRSPRDLNLIINTHAHTDHIGGNLELWLASEKRARFVAHAADKPLIEDPQGAGAGPYQRYVHLGFITAEALASALAAGGSGVKVDVTVGQ